MKIIAIDTATDVCGISYLIDREIIHTIEDNIPRQHAKSLPLFYEKLCFETKLTLNKPKPIKKINIIYSPANPGFPAVNTARV